MNTNLNLFGITFKLTFINIFKISYILFLFIFFIYLLYVENINTSKIKTNSKYLESGFNSKYLRNIFGFTSGAASIYSIFLGVSSSEKDKVIVSSNRLLLEQKMKLDELNTKYGGLKAYSTASYDRIKEQSQTMSQHSNHYNRIESELKELNKKLLEKNISNNEKETVLAKVKELEISQDYHKLILQKAFNFLENELNEIDKKLEFHNKDISTNFAFDFVWEYIESLTILQKFAFAIFCFSDVILTSLITIIFILYGEYLIKRFDLENKYPKLSKIIQLRRNLQKYSIFISLMWILLVVLTEIIVSLLILFYL
jgi:hypothetical protein